MRYLAFLAIVAAFTLSLRIFDFIDRNAIAQTATSLSQQLIEMAQVSDAPPAAELNPFMETDNQGLQGKNSNLVSMDMVDIPASVLGGATPNAASATQPQGATASAGTNNAVLGSNISTRQLEPNEKALVDELGQRRLIIEQQETEIQRKIALLTAAEGQLVQRQKALEKLQQEIKTMVDNYEAERKEARSSVLSTYNVMKPRAAAAIFNDMNIDDLIGVVRAMNPRQLAKIMEEMNPAKSVELTNRLVNIELSVQ